MEGEALKQLILQKIVIDLFQCLIMSLFLLNVNKRSDSFKKPQVAKHEFHFQEALQD